ncbi:MAG: SDR family oxidoreductase [Geminicoccaceae bacterium]|nr:MAG: SDR family oxidoreductase [Geminicoccaceae bacterium]
MPTLLCFGFGYTARTLSERLLAQGWTVRGTSRQIEARALAGVELFPFDRGQPLPEAALVGVTHVLTSIAPDERGDPVLDVEAARLRRLPELAWAGYLGTTAVYGNRDGGWVDETSALRPTSPRGQRRVAAEAAWLASGLPAHVFRLAGIYGPSRSPVDQLMAGTARRIVKPGQVFSRIHVEDIAAVLLASIARPNPGAVYNVCDDEPAPPQDVVEFAARELGLPVPPDLPYETADLSPMARSFYLDNRRVRNDRIHEELGVELAFPTYREGLHALAARVRPGATASER